MKRILPRLTTLLGWVAVLALLAAAITSFVVGDTFTGATSVIFLLGLVIVLVVERIVARRSRIALAAAAQIAELWTELRAVTVSHAQAQELLASAVELGKLGVAPRDVWPLVETHHAIATYGLDAEDVRQLGRILNRRELLRSGK
jgi:hypothetical protein